MLVQALYNVVDRIFLGAGVNQMSIGGVYLIFPIFLFLMAFGMLIGVGGNSLSSIKFGEGKKKESEIILGTSMVLSIIFGVLISAIFLLNLKWFLKIFGASDTLMPYAYDYGKIILYGAPFQMVGFAMNNFIRGEGNPRAAMVTMFIGASQILFWIIYSSSQCKWECKVPLGRQLSVKFYLAFGLLDISFQIVRYCV